MFLQRWAAQLSVSTLQAPEATMALVLANPIIKACCASIRRHDCPLARKPLSDINNDLATAAAFLKYQSSQMRKSNQGLRTIGGVTAADGNRTGCVRGVGSQFQRAGGSRCHTGAIAVVNGQVGTGCHVADRNRIGIDGTAGIIGDF